MEVDFCFDVSGRPGGGPSEEEVEVGPAPLEDGMDSVAKERRTSTTRRRHGVLRNALAVRDIVDDGGRKMKGMWW